MRSVTVLKKVSNWSYWADKAVWAERAEWADWDRYQTFKKGLKTETGTKLLKIETRNY